ncbi:hypothetical protein Mapa_003462 [Marchantia paleacea]|nr:hypothetical protein Mapa_003462 [Marchantia paleacea]
MPFTPKLFCKTTSLTGSGWMRMEVGRTTSVTELKFQALQERGRYFQDFADESLLREGLEKTENGLLCAHHIEL